MSARRNPTGNLPAWTAVILAGGQSSRMGRDKAWMEAEGVPLIELALGKVRGLGAVEVFISGRPGEDYSRLGCPVLLDLEPGLGPMAGIERALRAASTPLVLVLAVDLPNMKPAFLRKLLANCDRLTGAVPTLDGTLEPLAAVYPKRCYAFAFSALVNLRRSARDFASACLREHAVRKLSVSATDASGFANWNSPSDVPSC